MIDDHDKQFAKLTMVGVIEDLETEEVEPANELVIASLAAMKESYKETPADDEVLFRICMTVAYHMANLSTLSIHSLSDVIKATFNTYALAAATLAGEYNPGEPSEELKKRISDTIEAIKTKTTDNGGHPDEPITGIGQYL